MKRIDRPTPKIEIRPDFAAITSIADSYHINVLPDPRIRFIYVSECSTIELHVSSFKIQLDRSTIQTMLLSRFGSCDPDLFFDNGKPRPVSEVLKDMSLIIIESSEHWPELKARMLAKMDALITELNK